MEYDLPGVYESSLAIQVERWLRSRLNTFENRGKIPLSGIAFEASQWNSKLLVNEFHESGASKTGQRKRRSELEGARLEGRGSIVDL